MTSNPQHITLSELQGSISQTLRERFPLPVWVAAEVSDVKVNYSGHCYMELVEKGESDGVARAQARAVIWRSAYSKIVGHFEAESGVKLERGVKILAKVMVNYHELYGLSLQITDISPAYTLGEVERQRLLTIARLQKDGVWDMNREHTLPMLAQRVAVVSSSRAAGYGDFCNEITANGYHFSLTLFDSVMQGVSSEESIIDSLCQIADSAEEFDCVVIIRGGGSTSDLGCFNSYRLASYVAQFPLPVIAGIGHDKDQSVVDMVAHTTLKTPTAVAGWFTQRSASIDEWLHRAAISLKDITSSLTQRYSLQLELLKSALQQESTALFDREIRRLDHVAETLESHSPERILRLGFSLLRATNGGVVTSAKTLREGDEIEIKLRDGVVGAKITSIK